MRAAPLLLLAALMCGPATAAAQGAAAQPSAPPAPDAPVRPPFPEWLQGVREEALARGISPQTIAAALGDVQPVAQILERDRAQAEFKETLQQYLDKRIGVPTVRLGRQKAEQHKTLLARVAAEYKVPPHVLVAVWGLESNFGRFSGVRPTIPTLATLAYDNRRSALFRSQLFDALIILDAGHIELPRLKGSWAGAMGQPQFMPSSYLTYAVDFDGDGKRDIWASQADVFASIANYLSKNGWIAGQTWGRKVTMSSPTATQLAEVPLRATGCRAAKEMTDPRPLAEWQAMGVRTAEGAALPTADVMASLLRTDSGNFLVYQNYETFLSYNCAHAYAMAVAQLSDRIAATDPLPAAKAKPKASATSKGKAGRTSGARPAKSTTAGRPTRPTTPTRRSPSPRP